VTNKLKNQLKLSDSPL